MIACAFTGSGLQAIHSDRVQRLPYMAAIGSLTKKRYAEIDDKGQKMDTCTICLELYKADD